MNYISKMAGTHNWHGTKYGSVYNTNGSWTAYSNPVNVTFTIEVKADSSIIIDYLDSPRLYFRSMDTFNKSIYFTIGVGYLDITYYYAGNSIVYKHQDVGVHVDDHLDLSTP